MSAKRQGSIFEIIVGDLFAPDDEEKHSVLWWVFRGPGKILLWIEYMFPDQIANAIGSARRRRSTIVQVWYSICFYIGVIVVVTMFVAASMS